MKVHFRIREIPLGQMVAVVAVVLVAVVIVDVVVAVDVALDRDWLLLLMCFHLVLVIVVMWNSSQRVLVPVGWPDTDLSYLRTVRC